MTSSEIPLNGGGYESHTYPPCSVPGLLCHLGLDPNCLRVGGLRHFEFQDPILQGRVHLGSINLCRQVNDPEDLLRAALGIERLALLVFFLSFMLPSDCQSVRFDVNLEFVAGEAWHFSPNFQVVVRFSYFQVQGVQQFGLGANPILQFVTEPPAVAVKDFECSSSDCVIGLLYAIEDLVCAGLLDWHGCSCWLHCCCCLCGHLCSPRFGGVF